MQTALIIVDVQNDYFPDGRMELRGSVEAAERIRAVLGRFRAEGWPVFHIRHVATRPGASFFLPNTAGAEIRDAVRPEGPEIVIEKHYPNSFRGTDLDERLRKGGIGRLAIAGMMTHMCVDSTTRAAFDLGYECVVLGDCCATRDLSARGGRVEARDVQASFLAALDGTFARVADSGEWLRERG